MANYIESMDIATDNQIPAFDEILADFELLDDWEDRYRYVIELGRKLKQLPDEERNAQNKVVV
jgi:cysteine desulfuration protein SufE